MVATENIIEESQLSKAFALDDRPTEIIWILDIRNQSFTADVVAKYSASKQSNKSSSTPARKSHSKKRIARTPAMVERIQTLISEDPG